MTELGEMITDKLSNDPTLADGAPGDLVLTDRQQERRGNLLRAAVRLAAEGGYGAVQMRSVAETAGVAMGTLYNYFASKDHLLAAALLSWNESLLRLISDEPPQDAQPADRMMATLKRALDAMWSAPDVSKAMMTAMMTPSAEVAECKERLNVSMMAILSSAFDAGTDVDHRTKVARTIEHVWYSLLIAWVNGWMTPDDVERELDDAVRLTMAQPG